MEETASTSYLYGRLEVDMDCGEENTNATTVAIIIIARINELSFILSPFYPLLELLLYKPLDIPHFSG